MLMQSIKLLKNFLDSLRDRKDENDPGFGLPKSQLSSLVFEILFQSIQSNESSLNF